MDKCKHCQSTNLVLESRISGQDVLTANQVALKCGDCGKWLKWCPKDERQRYIDKESIWRKYDPTEIEKIVLDYENMKNRISDMEQEQIEEMKEHQEAIILAKRCIQNLEEQIGNKRDLFNALDSHDRRIEERVLFDVLGMLYFQDYNRACDYDKMTGAEVVAAQHKILKEIQERYKYDFDRDFRP